MYRYKLRMYYYKLWRQRLKKDGAGEYVFIPDDYVVVVVVAVAEDQISSLLSSS